MDRAVFLDRDGVINRKAPEGLYVIRWDEMHLLPGVVPAVAELNHAGFRVIVVTNQRCVAKGLITVADLDSMHQRMCETLAASGARIDAVYYCPHEEELSCGCRKPAPGMLLDAASRHKIDLRASWMIGDSEADVQAGRSAGCKTALVASIETSNAGADLVAASLLDAVRQIVKSRCKLANGVPDDQDVSVQPDSVSA